MQISPRLRWFHRRPLFWCALAAIAAVATASGWQVPVAAWCGLLPAAILLAALRLPEAATALALAGFFGIHAAAALSPGLTPSLRDGQPVTLRGALVRVLPGSGEVRRAVLETESRLTIAGWTRQRGKVGLYVPAEAARGDIVQVSGILRRPLPPANPGAPSPRLDWARRGAGSVLSVRPGGYARLGRRPLPPWEMLAGRIRSHILAANRATLTPAAAGIANDFLIGDSDPPDPELAREIQAAFRDSGTVHLLVVSGTQVTLVLGLFVWLGWRFWRWRWLLWGAGLAALGFYHLLTQGDASVSRAAAMGCIVVLALVFQREADGENCLGGAALLLLILNPLTLFDIGAQLSFLAVWSLIRLSPPLASALGPAPLPENAPHTPQPWTRALHRAFAAVLAASLAAHLGVAPILALHFQRSGWAAVPANVIQALLAVAFMAAAALHNLLASLGISLLSGPVSWLAAGLHGWAIFFSRPPFGSGDVFPPPLWLLLPYLVLMAVPAALRLSRAGTLAVAAGLAGVLVLSERVPAPPPQAPTVRALDVGQGDCIVLQSPDGSSVLVDGGPPGVNPERSAVTRALRALRVPELDAVVVSHPHADHIGGLPALIERFPVRTLIHAVRGGPPEWRDLLHLAARRGVAVVEARAGDRIRIRNSTLTVLAPLPDLRPVSLADPNEESLVCRWDSGGARVLLAGDAPGETEQALLRWNGELRCDLLKSAPIPLPGS